MINIKYRLLSAVVFTACLASCSQQDIPMPQPESPQAIAITVSDGGYISDSPSRASENGYFTNFTAGDACGLYFVQEGEIIASNFKVVAAEANGALQWKPADGKEIYLDSKNGVKAFLYYPYQEDMTGKVTASATDDAGFFAPLISGWQPKVDQSDYATGYAASDLMTAAGTFSENSIAFPMTHRMALAVFDLPKIVYKFTDNTIPDYVTPVSTEFTEDAIPCLLAGGYRYLVNPAAAEQPTVTATYNERDRIFTVSTSGLTASTYKTFVIDGGSTTGQQVDYDLQVGDFFCSTPDASGWYVIPKDLYPTATDNCIGLVFKAGKDASDISDYTKPLNEGGPVIGGTFHGYVMALTNVDNPRGEVRMYWVLSTGNVSPGKVGTSTSSEDWNGYDNCQIIHDKVAENSGAGWSMTNFPATLACETYGNRTVDYRGNPTDAYAWQSPFVAPANTSGWFLPSIAQLKYLYDNQNDLISKIETAKEKAPSTVAYYIDWFATSDRYFSSTEGSANQGAVYNINFRDGNCREDLKNKGCNVRAVLAF